VRAPLSIVCSLAHRRPVANFYRARDADGHPPDSYSPATFGARICFSAIVGVIMKLAQLHRVGH